MLGKAPIIECPEVLPKELTSSTLRRGKWTVEEERYTEKIIGTSSMQLLFAPLLA